MRMGVTVRRMAFVVGTVCAGAACAEGGPTGREVAPAQPGGQAFQASAAREAPRATRAEGPAVFAVADPHPASARPHSFDVGTGLTLLVLAALVATARPVLCRC